MQNQPCIYVVDDEAVLAQLTSTILSARGYDVVFFNHPQDAIRHVQQNPRPSALLVTDCIMGEMNGLELIEAFRQCVPDLRSILLSGTITDAFIEKCQVQPDRFISKPYTSETLLREVQSLLARP